MSNSMASISQVSESFDPWSTVQIPAFILFVLLTAGFPCIIARPVLHVIEFELHSHRVRLAHQLNDFYKAIPYSMALFAFGNYAYTFNWIMPLVFVLTIFIYASIAEISFLKVSLHSNCNWKARLVISVGFVIILALAVFHFYLAWVVGILWPWYSMAALIGITMAFVLPFLVHHLDVTWNLDYECHRMLRKAACKLRNVQEEGVEDQHVFVDNDNINNFVQKTVEDHSPSKSPRSGCRVRSPPPGPDKSMISVHVHHWQLFILLAFFTRFENVISNICAGIVLGIYAHGIAAYGFDEVIC